MFGHTHTYTHTRIHTRIHTIRMMVRMFTNVPGDQSSILGRVIPKTQKMVLDASLLKCPRRVLSKVPDCGLEGSDFELCKLCYVHFRTNILGKGMNPHNTPTRRINLAFNNQRKLIYYSSKKLNETIEPIDIMVWLFTNGPGDRGSILRRIVPKTNKKGTWCLLILYSALWGTDQG